MHVMNFVVVFSALCGTFLIAKPTSSRNKNWWPPIRDLIQSPCSPPSDPDDGQSETQTSPVDLSAFKPALFLPNPGCLPLNKSTFIPSTEEALGMVAQLLKAKRVRRWVRGYFTNVAKEMYCKLDMTVASPKRKGLTKAQMKVTEDLIQLASFAYFLEQATIGGKNIQARMKKLSHKLKIIACSLREAVTTPDLLPYVTSDDVPKDLRRKKRKARGRVATYVIMEKLQEFLRFLPNSYQRKDLKICRL